MSNPGPSTSVSRPSTPGAVADNSRHGSRNPIQLRLRKILGSTYDDPSTREALETLSDLYASQELQPGQRRVNGKAQSTELEHVQAAQKSRERW